MVKYVKGQKLFYVSQVMNKDSRIDYKIEECIVEEIDESLGVTWVMNLATRRKAHLGLEHSSYTHYYFTLEEAEKIVNGFKRDSIWVILSKISIVFAGLSLIMFFFTSFSDNVSIVWVYITGIGIPFFFVVWLIFLSTEWRRARVQQQKEFDRVTKEVEESQVRNKAINKEVKKEQEQRVKEAYEKVAHIWPYGNKTIRYAQELSDGYCDIVYVNLIPLVGKRSWKIIIDDEIYEKCVIGQSSVTFIDSTIRSNFVVLNKDYLLIGEREWKNMDLFPKLSSFINKFNIDGLFMSREYLNANKDILDRVEKYRIHLDSQNMKSEQLLQTMCEGCIFYKGCKFSSKLKSGLLMKVRNVQFGNTMSVRLDTDSNLSKCKYYKEDRLYIDISIGTIVSFKVIDKFYLEDLDGLSKLEERTIYDLIECKEQNY